MSELFLDLAIGLVVAIGYGILFMGWLLVPLIPLFVLFVVYMSLRYGIAGLAHVAVEGERHAVDFGRGAARWAAAWVLLHVREPTRRNH